MPTTTLSNEEILEAIGHKSVLELADLIEAFKTKFNVTVFMDTIVRAKPSAAKGTYIRSATISSTMGPGVRLETAGYR